MENTENLMAFFRKSENQTLLVLANCRKESRTLTLPSPYQKVLLNNYDSICSGNDNTVTLNGYQAVILELA